jgi:hypothetical protein
MYLFSRPVSVQGELRYLLGQSLNVQSAGGEFALLIEQRRKVEPRSVGKQSALRLPGVAIGQRRFKSVYPSVCAPVDTAFCRFCVRRRPCRS